MRALYFGCHRTAGHYLFSPGMRGVYRTEIRSLPFNPSNLDGLFECSLTKQSEAVHFHMAGWSVLWMVDNSVDKRPGSCAFFMVEGAPDLETTIGVIKESFPDVLARIEAAAPITTGRI